MGPITLPYDEAVQRIRKAIASDECAFVARVSTPWTILGVEAWLREKKGAGYLLVVPNRLNAEAAFSSPIAHDPRVTVIKAEPRTEQSRKRTNMRRLADAPWFVALLAQKRTGTPLDILSAREADTGFLFDLGRSLLRRDVRIHLVDQGFGKLPVELKTDTRPTANNARLQSKGSWLRYAGVVVRARGRVIAARLIMQRLPTFEHNLITWDPVKKTTAINTDVQSAYRAIFASREKKPIARSKGARFAVLATTPLSDYLNATAEVEARLVEDVARKLLDKGFDVIVKPHPRERQNKYEGLVEKLGPRARLLPGSLPAEELLHTLAPEDVVVGYTSQSLLSASVLFDLRAYTITPALAKVDVNPALLDDYRAYERAFPVGAVGELDDLLGAAPG